MQTKGIYGFIFSITLGILLITGSFRASDSKAHTYNHNKVQINNPTSLQIIAQETVEEFVLPPLPYAYDALDAYIDSQTMTLHHDKHHAGYVKNLNEAISIHPELKGKSAEELISNLDDVPEDIVDTVRNNGGGHVNHTVFWSIMTPNSQVKPSGVLAEAINAAFGDFETLKKEFNAAGKKHFGSGWVWLIMNDNGELEITSTPNQDNPLMDGQYPIMGNDVWEHAYYLKYQNNRDDYLEAWWNVVNWQEVNSRFQQALDFV